MVFMDNANTGMHRLLGILAKVLGQLEAAAVHFEDGLVLCRECGYRPELAWVRYEYANLLIENSSRAAPGESGYWEKGMTLLNEGLSLAEELGMKPLLERVLSLKERATSQNMGNEAKGPSNYPDDLTHREVDVLRLMAAGKSNQQVADELFISVHTVIYHVRNIYSKTGASNRVEAASYAVRHRLVT